jgi:hypothetical protein
MLIPPHRKGEDAEILGRILAGDRVDHYETERVTKDGRPVWVSLTVSPIFGASGKIEGASVIARDITARRRADERAARLRTVAAAFSESLAPERVVEVVLEQALPTVGADAATVALPSEDGDALELVASAGHDPEQLGPWRRMSLDQPLPITEAVRSRAAAWIESADERRALPGARRREAPLRGGGSGPDGGRREGARGDLAQLSRAARVQRRRARVPLVDRPRGCASARAGTPLRPRAPRPRRGRARP